MRGLLIALLVAAAPASAQELKQLLDKGPMVMVESEPNGRFKQATAVVYVDRTPDEVWRVLSDLSSFKEFMPKMMKSEAKVVGANEVDVEYELDTPGANARYTLRFTIDAKNKTMAARWVKGDMRSSTCAWRVIPYGKKGSLVYYENGLRNFSALAESLEDEQQTVTVGLNVTAALAAAKAAKARAEQTASAQAR